MRIEKKKYSQPLVSVIEMHTLSPLQTSGTEVLPMDPSDPGGTGEALSKKTGRGFWDDEESE